MLGGQPRTTPRWSTAGAPAGSPAASAGLPGNRAAVGVGPPLSASGPSLGSATPTRLPRTPFVRPPLPPVPIRLDRLAGSTVPPMSEAPAGPAFPATMVLSNRAVPAPVTASPPPVELVPTSCPTVLAVIVSLVRVIG